MKVYKSSLSRLFCLHNETLVLMRLSTGFWDFVQVMVGWWPYVEPVEYLNFLVSFLVKCLIRVQWVCGQPTGIHCICDAYSALSRFFSFESLTDFQMRNRKLKEVKRLTDGHTNRTNQGFFWWSLHYLTCLEK